MGAAEHCRLEGSAQITLVIMDTKSISLEERK